jgi:hypothetical protein
MNNVCEHCECEGRGFTTVAYLFVGRKDDDQQDECCSQQEQT